MFPARLPVIATLDGTRQLSQEHGMNTLEFGPEDKRYTRKIMEAVIRVGIVALLILWSFEIFKPFLGPIVWGIIISIACFGIFSWLKERVGGRDGLAATLFALIALALLITPTIMLSESTLQSAQTLSQNLDSGSVTVPPPPQRVANVPIVGEQVYETWSLASRNLEGALDRFKPQIEALSKALLARAIGTGVDILLFAVSIIIAAVFMAYAESASRMGRSIFVRLAGERGAMFVDLTRDVVNSVARGVLGIAVIQTFFLALGLIVGGVPAAGVLAVITLLFAVAQIPMLLLYLPIIAFMFATADTTVATFFAIWSVFFCFADGFLKPLLLGRGLMVPMPIILIGVIGGMVGYGIVGLFVGPIVLSFSYVLFMIWLEGPGMLAKDNTAGTEEAPSATPAS
jgi:predicted PurR-regulated permease PerM